MLAFSWNNLTASRRFFILVFITYPINQPCKWSHAVEIVTAIKPIKKALLFDYQQTGTTQKVQLVIYMPVCVLLRAIKLQVKIILLRNL